MKTIKEIIDSLEEIQADIYDLNVSEEDNILRTYANIKIDESIKQLQKINKL